MSEPLVVDTSAAVAVVLGEPRHEDVREALNDASRRSMAAPSLVELGMVLFGRLGPSAEVFIERFLLDGRIDVIAFDRSHVVRALEGFRRFGKGRHRAALNFGDCLTYGLAMSIGDPILCVGDDFRHTDADVVDVT